MMIVVSNSGPLIHLAKLSILSVLKDLYSVIFIPPLVYNETVMKGKQRGYDDARIIEEAIGDWIIIVSHTPDPKFRLQAIQYGLDEGEIQAISMAWKYGALLLIDDKKGREFSRKFGIMILGTVGIIISAAERGIISKELAIKKLKLLPNVMYISQDVINEAIRKLKQTG